MKTLALKNPESVTADVVLETTRNGFCNFCGEEDKPLIAGKPIYAPSAVYYGKAYPDWAIYERRISRGAFSPDLLLKVLSDNIEPEKLYRVFDNYEEPTICFDCIRQLAKLIPKQ